MQQQQQLQHTNREINTENSNKQANITTERACVRVCAPSQVKFIFVVFRSHASTVRRAEPVVLSWIWSEIYNIYIIDVLRAI